jgi:hypothetical protein
MITMTQLRPVHSEVIGQIAEPSDQHSAMCHLAGRLIQVTLALYLLPAFLVVLMVGGLGILTLKTCRGLAGLLEG